MSKRARSPVGKPRGFTLIELILSLSLSVLLLMAVGIGVYVHLNVLDVGRTDIEQAQIARAVLQQIASDLRATIAAPASNSATSATGTTDSTGTTGQSTTGQSTTTGTGAGGGDAPSTDFKTGGSGSSGGSAGSGSSGGTGTPSTPSSFGSTTSGATGQSGSGSSQTTNTAASASTMDNSSQTTDTTSQTETTQQAQPGLYGDNLQIQVDIARLPRLGQYAEMMSAISDQPMADRYSDLRSVTYFVADPANPVPAAFGVGNVTGLVRCEVDQAVNAFGVEQGRMLDPTEYQVLAPEITQIEFRYYDGTQWLDQWRSDESGGLPLAVEVAISVEKPGTSTAGALLGLTPTNNNRAGLPRIYRLLVHLPNAQAAAGTSTGTTTDGSQDSSSSGTSSQSGTGSTGTTGGSSTPTSLNSGSSGSSSGSSKTGSR